MNPPPSSPLMAAMLRAACLLALVAATATGQEAPPAPAARFTLLLRDPGGAPVADAEAALAVTAPGPLPALAWFAARAAADPTALPALQPLARLRLRSDARGVVLGNLAVGAGSTAAGCVTTANGLGALVVGLQDGRPQRIVLAPLAALADAMPGEPVTVHARVRTGDGAVTLPPATGPSVRLPAGDHDAWIRTARGWQWRRLALVAGQTVAIAAEAPRRRVRRPAPDWQLLPEGRADVPLFAAGEDEVALLGAAAGAAFTAWHPASGQLLPAQALPPATGDDAVVWPLAAGSLQPFAGLAAQPPGHGAVEAMALVQRTAAGEWLPLGIAARVGDDGRGVFQLPAPPAGDCWFVHVCAGRAPLAAPHRAGAGAEPTAAGAATPLAVAVRDASGTPVADVALAYEPLGMAAAMAIGRTDDRGRAGLGAAMAPGVLRVVDARFANQSLAVASATGAIEVVVDEGARLCGVARWPDGAPARGAVVTLRDPRGLLAPATRTAAADDDGRFDFAGLVAGGAYVVFATARRDGRTWSGRAETTAGSDAPLALAVRDEDPAFAPPRR